LEDNKAPYNAHIFPKVAFLFFPMSLRTTYSPIVPRGRAASYERCQLLKVLKPNWPAMTTNNKEIYNSKIKNKNKTRLRPVERKEMKD